MQTMRTLQDDLRCGCQRIRSGPRQQMKRNLRMNRIPSTQTLRVFQRAATALSFSAASEELCLTQSAVSHQIKQLEDHLGVSLFVRHRRGIALSDAGFRFLCSVSPLLEQLESAVAAICGSHKHSRLVVRVEDALLFSGLLPVLSDVLTVIPELTIEFLTCDQDPSHLLENGSISIYLGRAIHDRSIHCRSIAPSEFLAVCAPSVLSRHPISTVDDLSHHRLLVVRNTNFDELESDWESSISAPDRSRLSIEKHVYLNSRALALEAALAGQGIALAPSLPAIPHLISGRLVSSLSYRNRAGASYHFACAENLIKEPSVRLFQDWIIARADALVRSFYDDEICSSTADPMALLPCAS